MRGWKKHVNRNKFQLMLLVILRGTLPASDGYAAEKRCVDYEQPHKIVLFAKQSIRSQYAHLKTVAEVRKPGLTVAELRMWLERGGKVTAEIPIKPDGVVELPIIGEEAAGDTDICINQPKDAAGLSIELEARPPTKKVVPYRELFALLDDVNDFSDEMAGVFSLFVRDKDVIVFKFQTPATIEVVSRRRPRTFSTSDELTIEIERHADWQAENPKIRFSAFPTEILPQD